MELRQMRYFQAVAEAGSFRCAAARLHVAQPALSRQIHALEQMLGVTVLERQARGTRLTEAGQALLEDVRRILADLSRAQDKVRRIGQGHIGTIRVGLNEIAARRRYLPGFFHATRERYSEIDIRVIMLVSQMQLEALHAGTIDAGFLFHRPIEDENLQAIHVDSDDHVIALPRAHRLADKPKLWLRDLAAEPFIMMSQHANRVLYDRLMAICVAGGMVPRQVHEANNEFVIVNLVAAGVGLAFLNRSFDALPSNEVVLRQVEDLSLPVKLELVWRRDSRSAALARFVETVASSEQVNRCRRGGSV